MVKPLKKSSRNGRFRGHWSRLSGDAPFQLQSQMPMFERDSRYSEQRVKKEIKTEPYPRW